MQFRTEIEESTYPFRINQKDKVLSIGSCFANRIGQYFTENKMNCLSNPYGVIYNPISVFRLLSQSLTEQPILPNYLTERDGRWYHYDFHSMYSNEQKDLLSEELNLVHKDVRGFIRKADYLIITLGTAFVHRIRSSQHIVANCHKKPSNIFERDLLTQKEIGIRFRQFYENLKMVNPKIKIIFTVSPVRHIKDTLQGNNLSKSLLRLACHYFCIDFKDVYYFPAYEILMDDLRDYRYYETDMIHVNEAGQNYVIEHFRKSAFSENLNTFIDQWQQVRNQLRHKPFNAESENHQLFLKKLLLKLEDMDGSIDLQKEKELVKAQLL
ncbi:MAG: GSCFA domain-containing protein [Cytophagales bacterium]|nr:GSCFA domain-containing protein [Cytophagales bacterium]